MNRILLLSLSFLTLAGCVHVAPAPSTGYLPEDAFGNSVVGQDLDLAAVNDAMIAFAYPGIMQGKPAQMALAIASLDAMAGQFSTGGRWITMDAITKQEMLDARTEVRAVLGVPEDAPSQSIIDHLVAASHALDRGDQTAALAALSGPDFTKTPEQTLAILTHFPRVPDANSATMEANMNFFPMDDDGPSDR
jgi:hypothetical protein